MNYKTIITLITFTTFIFLSLGWLLFSTNKDLPETEKIGNINKSKAPLLIKRFQSKDNHAMKYNLNEGDKLYNKDHITNNSNSEVKLNLSNNILAVKSNTELIIEKIIKKNIIEIFVLKGEVSLNSKSTTLPIKIISDNKIFYSKDDNKSVSNPSTLNILNQKNDLSTPTTNNPLTLSTTYLRAKLKKQESFIKKCFYKYFIDNQGDIKIGTTMLNFVIEPSGKISSLRTSSPNITDANYISCVKSVFLRVKFKKFKSSAIHFAYPVEIRL